MKRLLAGMLLWSAALLVHAHPLAPAMLAIDAVGDGTFRVLWKTSAQTFDPVVLRPRLPAHCKPQGQAFRRHSELWVLEQFSVDCGEQGLVGHPVQIDGLARSVKDVLLQFTYAGQQRSQQVLRARAPEAVIPARPSVRRILVQYCALGVRHILSGYDHLLLVVAFVILLPSPRALLLTLTGFTLGHSVTLTLAALGLVRVPMLPVEALIAFTIVLLAAQILRHQRALRGSPAEATGPAPAARPWWLAGVFGLLHGLGFAGALAQIGLPGDAAVPALAAFNVGVELGQLLIVAGWLLIVGWLFARTLKWINQPSPTWQRALPSLAAWTIGALAAFWTVQRTALMWM